eukprot:6174721-Amphidinium_carterae.1
MQQNEYNIKSPSHHNQVGSRNVLMRHHSGDHFDIVLQLFWGRLDYVLTEASKKQEGVGTNHNCNADMSINSNKPLKCNVCANVW